MKYLVYTECEIKSVLSLPAKRDFITKWFHPPQVDFFRRRRISLKKHLLSQVLFWWGMVDSDHRSRWQQIYSLPPLAAREIPHIVGHVLWPFGAGDRSRTNNLLITNQLLCHWATPANCSCANDIRFRNGNIISQQIAFVKPFLKKYFLFLFCSLFTVASLLDKVVVVCYTVVVKNFTIGRSYVT